MAKKLTDDDLRDAVIRSREMGNAKAAKFLGITESTLRSRLIKAKKHNLCGYIELEESVSGEKRVLTGKSYTIRTLEAALEEAKVDLAVWEVERFVINKWDMAAKTKQTCVGENDKAWDLTATELWQVKVWLKRKLANPVVDAIERLVAKNWKPLVTVAPAGHARHTRHLLEVSLFDTHFGKLAWGVETGEDYDLDIARTVYLNAAEDLIDRIAGYDVEQILFPIGNDFFHVNSWKNTTVNDTAQDVDTRMSKIFEVGCESVIRCIERCVRVAPVNVLWIPGNHDAESSWYMAKFVEAWYRNVPEVRVNKDPIMRKYVGYGSTLLGFTHGNEERHQDLPLLMATEQPELWSKSTTRVFHIGHFHKKKETRFDVGDTYNGVSVQVLPSLSGVDAWHFKKGYVKGNRAAEAYLWNHDEGYVGHFSSNVRV